METENNIQCKNQQRRPIFTLQWHLTTSCPNRCRHCYMERNARVLSLEECKAIVDDFRSVLKRWNCNGRIHFTGGDPLLYPSFFELLAYARFSIPGLRIGILGNPELLSDEIVRKLKENDVFSYQMSLDGLGDTHDYFRYNGSFRNTLSKISLLRSYGIRTDIMTTVNKMNLNQLPSIVDVVVDSKVDFFGFKRFVPIGEGQKLKGEAFIPPNEFREMLVTINKKYEEHKSSNTAFGGGEPLWKLFHFEKGGVSRTEIRKNKLIWGGCSIGYSGLTILEDGTVLACRRLPLTVGKVPRQKIRDIFVFSESLNGLRELKKLAKCSSCELLLYCRGCRAVAYGITGDYFQPDPQCWK